MGVRQSPMRKPRPRFTPHVDKLEDRTTPATLYVDPAFAVPSVPADGTLVTFNAGYTGTVSDLKYASTLAAWQADNTRVAFSSFNVALQVAETNAGADEIRVARSTTPIPVDNSAGAVDPVTGGLHITQNLTIIGSGEGASVLAPTSDSVDELTSVFRVSGNTTGLIAQDLTLDAAGKNLGFGFVIRDGAAGTFRRVTVRDVEFNTAGVSNEGMGIIGFAGAILDVLDSRVEGSGRVGIQYADSTGNVFGTVVTGRGAGDFITNGIEVYGNSTVTISGSTITGNSGRVGTDTSAGVLIYEDSGNEANTTLIGNLITGNAVGLTVGVAASDPSVMRAEFNNILNNDVGADATNSSQGILAQNNWWGTNGPFHPTDNPTGKGNIVTDKVTFVPFLGTKTPIVSAATTDLYRTLTTTTGVAISPTPGQANPVLSGAVRFTVTFALPVTGFDAADVVITAPTGSVPTTQVTGSGTTYTVTVNGLAGNGLVTAMVNAQGAVASDGTLNAASGTATINFGVAPSNTPPGITDVANQSVTTGGSTSALAFTVADAETPASALTVTGSSSDTTLVTSVVIGGTGAARTVTVTGAPGKTGTATITLTVSDAQNANAIDTFTVAFTDPTVPPTTPPAKLFAVGPDVGGGPQVRVYNPDGTVRFNFFAYAPDFTGGVRVATGDVNGDGTDDIIVAAGVGGGPHIRVIDGVTQADIASFFAYENTVRNGAHVAAADLDGDGKAEIITGAGVGGGPAVAVFSGTGVERFRFFAYENTARGGVFVAGGDVDGDGKAEIITGAGVGGGPVVAVFNGADATERTRFFAYDSASRNGVFVASGNLSVIGPSIPTPTGRIDEIVTGPGTGSANVKVFDGRTNSELTSFIAYPGLTTGVRVAVNDTNRDGVPDIVTGPGPGGGPNIRGFAPFLTNRDTLNFFAFDPTFTGGVFVG